MAHKRVKNISYDDDYSDSYDYDEYNGGDEGLPPEEDISAEDEQRLQDGTREVRQRLGPLGRDVKDSEIRDKLWNSWYDVDQVLEELNAKRLQSQSSKKSKAESNGLKGKEKDKVDSSSDEFYGIQWGKIPVHRRGELIHVSTVPKLGLLGGAPKMSKLAALAAARKRQAEEARTDAAKSAKTERTVDLLDELSTSKRRPSTSSPVVTPVTSNESTTQLETVQSLSNEIESPKIIEEIHDLHVPPSIFAKTLFPTQQQELGGEVIKPSFGQPYATQKSYSSAGIFSRPSPDDIVLAAQSKGLISANAAKNLNVPKPKKAVEDELQNLRIEEKVTRKDLNVLEQFKKSGMKKSASFVVVGHVDHGKSTLMGRLLLEMKVVSEQTIRKYQKEAETIGKASFALAWVMDAGQDERERGVTVDTATKVFETEKTRFTVIDAPGHHDFIPNMIAGASQADFALLVIDAGINGFESGLRGQTREHALLVRSMGVRKIVVVVNKMDRVDWSQERFTEIKQQMSAFLAAANFPIDMISFIPCSGLNGSNVSKKLNVPEARWYTGPTLIEELDSVDTTDRTIDGPLRFKVDNVFRSPSGGWVSATGRLESGNVQVGDVVVVQPATQTATVKTIEADEDMVDWAVAGQMATLRLVNIDPNFVAFGDTICDLNNVVPKTKSFKAKILSLEHIMPMFVEIHNGRLQVQGRIAKLVATLDKATGEVEKKHPKVVLPGNVAGVVVDVEEEIPLEKGWRVVLRSEGKTVATGLVE